MGRPRKDGPRFPSGKLRPPTLDARVAPALIHRIRDNAGAAGIDRRFESEVGRLLLIEQLNALEAGAAWRIAEVYGRFDRFHAPAPRTVRSPDYDAGYRSTPAVRLDPDASAAAARDAFVALQERLVEHWPPRYRQALERLCVDGINVGYLMTAELRPILRWLATKHFGTKEPTERDDDRRRGHRERSSNFARDTEQLVTEQDREASERLSESVELAEVLKARDKFRAEKNLAPAGG